MDQFLNRHKLPTQREKEDLLNRPITINKMELIINKLPKKKVTGTNGFTGEFPKSTGILPNSEAHYTNTKTR